MSHDVRRAHRNAHGVSRELWPPGATVEGQRRACSAHGVLRGATALVLTRVDGPDAVQVVGRALRGPVALALILPFCVGCDRVALDENLCPRDRRPQHNTVLLLDTSDPLDAKHRTELRRLVRELQGNTADFRVAPGDALIVYELTPNLDALAPALTVCNPGEHPDEWGFVQELTRGRAIDLRRWQQFQNAVEDLFAQIETGTSLPRSPIIETLGVIVPRHAPSRRVNGDRDGPHTHLIVFSDLLQHSDRLSHYGVYPDAELIRETGSLRALQTDLTGIDVSLFRLERSPDARWQTRDHYYWWTELVHAFGGRVIWQESI